MPELKPSGTMRRTLVEAGVIVGSILLAFWIDAAWDRRLEGEARLQLTLALREDFVGTRAALDDVIPTVVESLTRTEAYTRALIDEQPIEPDSLRALYVATFDGFILQPPLSNYDGAITSGRLADVATPELRDALGRFDAQRAWWQAHLRTLFDTHYRGPTWELRRTIGTDALFRAPDLVPPDFRLTPEEMLSLLKSPEAYATAEVHRIIFGNIYRALVEMDSAAETVIEILDRAVDT